jgi:hypothetical protein
LLGWSTFATLDVVDIDHPNNLGVPARPRPLQAQAARRV